MGYDQLFIGIIILLLLILFLFLKHDKASEKQLKEFEQRYHSVLEHNLDMVYEFDVDGRFVQANKQNEIVAGYSTKDLINHNFIEFIVPEYHQDAIACFEGAIQGEPSSCETVIYHKQGHLLALSISLLPIIKNDEITGIIGIAKDITEKRKTEKQLRETSQTLNAIIDNAPSALIGMNGEREITIWNHAAERILGWEKEEVIGKKNPMVPIHKKDEYKHVHDYVMEHNKCTNIETKRRRKDGKIIDVSIHISPIQGEDDDQTTGTVAIMMDITERKQIEAKINHMAYHDMLTGLPNRLLFNENLNIAIGQAKYLKESLAVLFVDLDRFKLINDTFGHETGDKLLEQVAERISSTLSEGDFISRQGGDEFLILLTNREISEIEVVASQMLEEVAKPFTLFRHEFFTTASIGISLFPQDGDTIETLVKNADTAMYQAKDKGKNNYQFYNSDMNDINYKNILLEKNLHKALGQDEFIIYYQPKVSIDTENVTGVEALIRWNNEELGFVAPNEFIPLAEENGLIVPIGEWVLYTACAQNKAWQDAGLPAIKVSVNLSGRQFTSGSLFDTVKDVLDKTGLEPKYLELEITEGIMQNNKATIQTLHQLRELGVSVAIDDFGTGYSSLSYLKHLPINAVKIDKSFVDDIPTKEKDTAITKTIIKLGHYLQLEVIAEGVETREQLEFLKGQGCHSIQGYYYSRPLPANDLEKYIKESLSYNCPIG